MIFKQFFDTETSTFTYLLGCEKTKQAVLIDTVDANIEQYISELNKHNLELLYTLETHLHADHITAADALRQRLGCKSVIHRDAGASCGDLKITNGVRIKVGEFDIEVLYTPGHTNGCVSYLVNDMVFTGDALLINGCGRTDFQMGDSSQLFDSIHEKIFTLPHETLVYPGHDYNGNTVSSVGKEYLTNVRIKNGVSKESFIELMSNLKLSYPLKIDVALPANKECGQLPTV